MPAPSNLDGVLVQWGDRLFYPGNRIVPTRTPKLTGAGIHERAHATRQRIHAIVVRRAPQVMVCYKYQARRIREECRGNRKLIGRSPLDWPAMDRFLAIDAFVRVAETQNFAQAARQMRCSRSVITTRIQQLETFVGAPLFHRNTRSVRLSELGQAFLQDCVDLVGRTNDWALNKFFSDYGTWYLLGLGLMAIVVTRRFKQGLWGWVQQRWGWSLFPTRRQLVLSDVKD